MHFTYDGKKRNVTFIEGGMKRHSDSLQSFDKLLNHYELNIASM